MQLFGLRLNIKNLFLGVCLCLVLPASAQTQWQTDLQTALQLGAKQNKPVFVDFNATWCGPCKMLDANVFPDSRVKALFRKVICVHLDIDQHVAEAQKYQVSSIPRLMLFSPNGRQVLWDTMGYRDPDEFVQEFSEALHMKPPSAAPAVPEPAPLVKVRAALSKPGGLAKLEAADPAGVKMGLHMLVDKLGVYKEEDFQPPAALLISAGPTALPSLLQGMESKTLAVRVGSYKVVLAILGKQGGSHPAFDPWGSSLVRQQQVGVWRRVLASR